MLTTPHSKYKCIKLDIYTKTWSQAACSFHALKAFALPELVETSNVGDPTMMYIKPYVY